MHAILNLWHLDRIYDRFISCCPSHLLPHSPACCSCPRPVARQPCSRAVRRQGHPEKHHPHSRHGRRCASREEARAASGNLTERRARDPVCGPAMHQPGHSEATRGIGARGSGVFLQVQRPDLREDRKVGDHGPAGAGRDGGSSPARAERVRDGSRCRFCAPLSSCHRAVCHSHRIGGRTVCQRVDRAHRDTRELCRPGGRDRD